jgi:hypothetical protein
MRLECPIHGIVPREETVKGYEIVKDEYVRFESDELKALEQASSSMVVIDSFVPEGAIDPVYFENTYYLGAGKNGDRGYRVFAQALQKTHRIAVGILSSGRHLLSLINDILVLSIDWTPIEPCRAYVERLRQAGADAQITEYPGAHHGFDRPRAAVPHAWGAGGPPLLLGGAPGGHLVNRDTGLPSSVADPCVLRGVTVGPDPAAYRVALQAVKALLAPEARPSP